MLHPLLLLEPIKLAVDSSNELVYRISSFRGLSHGDGDGDSDADADAAVGLLKVSSQTSR